MVWQQHRIIRLNIVVLLYLMVCFVLCPVSAMTVSSPAEVHSVRGDAVTLTCTFTSTSRATSRMSVDWSYRPQTGGPPQAFFHFSSLAFPPQDGQFNGRVKWLGSPARGEASIQLLNASLSDNGTYTCSVRNPPDVHGSPTSQTVLTVTPKVPAVRFSDVAVLLAFILLPSTIIALALLGRMCCSPKDKSQAHGYHSPIEVTPEEEPGFKQINRKEKNMTCCDLYLLVEKNEEADQEIKQDEKKPEDKAHKAATKIQASFRGHILRKKMKDGEEDEEASPAVPEEAAKEAADGEEEKKEDVPPATEQAADEKDPTDVKEETSQAKSPISEKPANSPAPVATSPVAAAASPTAAAAPSEPPKEEAKAEPSTTKEKPKEVDSSEAPVSAQNPSTDCAEKSVEGGAAQEESKQADVPAATVSETADKEEPHQTQDKKDAAEESQPAEVPAEADQESKEDQEKV